MAAFKGIANRRRRRIRNGQRVFGQRIRNRMLRGGIPLPIRNRPYIPRVSGAAPDMVMAPVAAAASVPSINSQITRVQKTEMTVDVTGSVAFDSLLYPICAGDATAFPSCAALASQYNFFRFKWLKITYTPQCATSATGRIAIGVAPTRLAAEQCQSIADVSALQGAWSQNVWSGGCAVITQEHMNKQYLTQGYSIVDYENLNYNDPTQYQGIVVIGVEGCADTVIKGKLTIQYLVELLKAKVNDEGTAAMLFADSGTFAGGATSTTDIIAGFGNGQNFTNQTWWRWTRSGANTVTITGVTRHPYIISVNTLSTATNIASMFSAAGVDCVVTRIVNQLLDHHATPLASHAHQVYLVQPTSAAHSVVFTYTNLVEVVRQVAVTARIPRYWAGLAAPVAV